MSKARVRVGDVYAVPLGDGRYGYVQYIKQSDRRGPLLKVFNMVTKDRIQHAESLSEVDDMFGPIMGNIWSSVKMGTWEYLGKLAVPNIPWPQMVNGHLDPIKKCVHTWFLITEHEDIRLGSRLPAEYRALEFALIWTADSIADRIRTGEIQDMWWRPCTE